MVSKLEEVEVVLKAEDMEITEMSDVVVERVYSRGKGTFHSLAPPRPVESRFRSPLS